MIASAYETESYASLNCIHSSLPVKVGSAFQENLHLLFAGVRVSAAVMMNTAEHRVIQSNMFCFKSNLHLAVLIVSILETL